MTMDENEIIKNIPKDPNVGLKCILTNIDTLSASIRVESKGFLSQIIQDIKDEFLDIQSRLAEVEAENMRLKQWVNDLHSGMYINCVYCGHRYGPKKDTPVAMADVLKEHIEHCPKHPMSKLKAERDRLKKLVLRYADPLDVYPEDKEFIDNVFSEQKGGVE